MGEERGGYETVTLTVDVAGWAVSWLRDFALVRDCTVGEALARAVSRLADDYNRGRWEAEGLLPDVHEKAERIRSDEEQARAEVFVRTIDGRAIESPELLGIARRLGLGADGKPVA